MPVRDDNANDLRLAQKAEDMIAYAYDVLQHFPKAERHVLSAELRASMWRILRLIVLAAKRRDPLPVLRTLDAEIDVLRRQIRLSHRLRYLPSKQYEVWSRHLAEVGRMVGAWLKRAKG